VYGSIEHPSGHTLIEAPQIELDPDFDALLLDFDVAAPRFEAAAPPARLFDAGRSPVTPECGVPPRFPFTAEAVFCFFCPPRTADAFKSTPEPRFVDVTFRH
jgi:hypothetical protein